MSLTQQVNKADFIIKFHYELLASLESSNVTSSDYLTSRTYSHIDYYLKITQKIPIQVKKIQMYVVHFSE